MKFVSIKDYVTAEKQRIKQKIAAGNKKYRLDIFQIGNNPASNSYVKWKLKDCEEVGIDARLHKYNEDAYPEKAFQTQLESDIALALSGGTNGVLIQLPVPKFINADELIRVTTKRKQSADVDGFVYGSHDPCTPRGIIDWIEYNDYDLEGKNVVIIGRSDIVGKPLARMMLKRNATVTVCHSYTPRYDLLTFCDKADVVVSAVGNPRFLDTRSFHTYKTLIVDVGINYENGKLCGDIDGKDVIGKYCYATPVPGGVGLLTRLALLKNVIGE